MAEEIAFTSSSSVGTSNELLPQPDDNFLAETAILKEVMEEDLVCLNCHILKKEKGRLRNRIVTLEEQVSRRKRESRRYRR